MQDATVTGLVTKNAILLVDFANQLRAEDKSVNESLMKPAAVVEPVPAE